MAKAILNVLFVGILLAYPAFIYFGLTHYSLSSVAPVVLVAIIGRYVLLNQANNVMPWLLPASFMGGLCVLSSWLFESSYIALFYPIVISSVMLVTFVYSLVKGPTVIESFALLDAKRKSHDNDTRLAQHVVQYTRKVTYVWCIFFVINIAICAYTIVLQDVALWTFYNGLVAYVFMGLLFAIELIVRKLRQSTRHSDRVAR